MRTLAANGLIGSKGRVGACGDNAAMESFFSLLQKNVLDRRYWHARDELRLAIVTWIESTYHRRRRQRALGKLTPIESNCSTVSSQPRPNAPHPASQLNSGAVPHIGDVVLLRYALSPPFCPN